MVKFLSSPGPLSLPRSSPHNEGITPLPRVGGHLLAFVPICQAIVSKGYKEECFSLPLSTAHLQMLASAQKQVHVLTALRKHHPQGVVLPVLSEERFQGVFFFSNPIHNPKPNGSICRILNVNM